VIASRLGGAPVYGLDRRRLGTLVDVAIDEPSLTPAYLIVTFRGWWFMRREFRAIPWTLLENDEAGDLYLPMSREEVKIGPPLERPDLKHWSDEGVREEIHRYYANFGPTRTGPSPELMVESAPQTAKDDA
jgi:hypothetical protein